MSLSLRGLDVSPPGVAMDSVDLYILKKLQANARFPNSEIAKELGMAPSAIHGRIRKLEERGIIKGYHADVDDKALGYPVLAFVWIHPSTPNWSDDTAQALARIPEVQEVHEIVGEDSYLLKVRARDTEHLSEILKRDISRIDTVKDTKTTIVVRTEREDNLLPIEPGTTEGRRRRRGRELDVVP